MKRSGRPMKYNSTLQIIEGGRFMAAPSVESSASLPGKQAREKRNREKSAGAYRRSETLSAYLFLTPYLFVMLVFFVLVAIYGVGLSFFTVDLGFTAPV